MAITSERCKIYAKEWNNTLNCPEYLREVQKFLANETLNADYWLLPETKSKVISAVTRELVIKMAEKVIDKETGCIHMLK